MRTISNFKSGILISNASSAEDMLVVATLFRDYADALGVDLCFQDFTTELATLPGKYATPEGALMLARNADQQALGCVALRPASTEGCCEMKRLYVVPEARGMGLGRRLVAAILAEAVRLGYHEMRLDTLPGLINALALYEDVGFVSIPPYYDTPLKDTIFLAKTLP